MMDAMLLSAGLGKRMRPLTLETPKPLLKVGDRRLIEYHLERLSAEGISNVVINTSYAADQFSQVLGNGTSFGLNIRYSHEEGKPLETGGGIKRALGLLESDSFLAISADVWTDFPLAMITDLDGFDGNLLLVDNPKHNSKGDFMLEDGRVKMLEPSNPASSFTYGGISVLRKSLFRKERRAVFPLIDVFLDCIRRDKLTGVHYSGMWMDIGTPERLNELESMIQKS